MKYIFQLFVLILLISPAHAIEEIRSIKAPSPMPGPDIRKVGWEWHYLDQDGKPGFMRKTAGTDSTASYSRSDGCKWTRPTSGFAPATVWGNCPSTGSANVSFLNGPIWPLKIGNRFVYRIKGSSSLLSRAWSSKRSCKVADAVKIKITSGVYDTYKVVCKERWGTRTWWLSPAVGTAVAYRQKTRRGKLILQEMVKIVSPEG